jgi:hypothetical protein
MEGSFAQAANLHHFKRARWRRLWRQQIQDWLIAAVQNIKLWLRHAQPKPANLNARRTQPFNQCLSLIKRLSRWIGSCDNQPRDTLSHAFI